MRCADVVRSQGRERGGVENDSSHAKTGVLCIPLHCKGLDDEPVARYFPHMADLDPPRSKFAAYRARKKAAGFKEIRRWVWDVNSPAFIEQMQLEAEILKDAPEEKEALDFIEAVMAETMKDHPY